MKLIVVIDYSLGTANCVTGGTYVMDICSLSIGLTNLKNLRYLSGQILNAFSCFANNDICVAVIWILA